MRKFAFIKVVAIVASLMAVQSFAQPRDLFAEFEEEAAAADAAAEKAEAEKKAAEEKAAAEKAEAEKKAAEEKAAAEKAEAERKAEEAKLAAAKKVAEEEAAKEKQKEADRDAYERATMSPEAYAELQARRKAEEEQRIQAEKDMERMNRERQAAMARATQYGIQQDSIRAAADATTNPDSAYAAAMAEMAERAKVQEDLDAIAQDSAAVAQMIADSIAQVEAQRRSDSLAVADSIARANSSSSLAIGSSSSMSRRDLLGPVKVSKVNGIDEMKGRYKNPRKALFMSLVVPGSGQLYVGGSAFTNVRGGVYLALEAALWGSWYYFSVHKYNKQVDRYKDYANKHYSIGRYETEMRSTFSAATEFEKTFRDRYLGSRESFCEAIYGSSKHRGCLTDQLYKGDNEYVNDFVKSPQDLGTEMDRVHFDDASEVYSLIAGEAYVLGWDDASAVGVASLNLEDPNGSAVVLGSSKNQEEYRSMRSKANDYADMQAWFFGGLILNHIISAVDAALTANSHNKTLYQEDLSWYDHLHFDSGVSFFDGLGVNVQASWGF